MFLKLSAGCCLSVGILLAQTAPTGAVTRPLTVEIGDAVQFGPIGITTVMAGPMQTIAGAPYSADAVTERVQTLTDGNRIVQKTTGAVARDGQGRIRRDEALPGFISIKGENPHLVVIDDPVAGVSWNLDARTKTAVKRPLPAAGKGAVSFNRSMPPPLPPLAAGGGKTFFYSTNTMPDANVHVTTDKTDSSQVTKSDLGTQNIEGVAARGTRVTRTLPAGAVGNEQPLVITTDSWFSPELKVLISTKTEDPRMGETTYKLTNLQRGEPSPDLFEVPSDYTVKDGSASTMIFRTAPDK